MKAQEAISVRQIKHFNYPSMICKKCGDFDGWVRSEVKGSSDCLCGNTQEDN